ncbi:histidinol phosphatase, partial [Bacillus spizizenii]|nr:histidinol phosphatase [Bacillus spizizenii]
TQYSPHPLKKGFDSITFTEPAPLPPSFTDPTPLKYSAMAQASLERYINEISLLKKEYRGQLAIRTGLEVDYSAEFEDEITLFL